MEARACGLFFPSKADRADEQEQIVDVFQVTVEKCFVLPDFNEEQPLYILDIGGTLLVLFGQWVFDPHTLVASEALFETWKYDCAFFKNFSLRCLAARGPVFQLQPNGGAFVQAERLLGVPRFRRLQECQFVTRRSTSLIGDLVEAGIAEG